MKQLSILAALLLGMACVTSSALACPGGDDKPDDPESYCPGGDDKPDDPETYCPGGDDEPDDPEV
ncbi:MAG: hypothetical protein PVI30_17175 [Myxococcales bacterium]|jgi:hypothetical protein